MFLCCFAAFIDQVTLNFSSQCNQECLAFIHLTKKKFHILVLKNKCSLKKLHNKIAKVIVVAENSCSFPKFSTINVLDTDALRLIAGKIFEKLTNKLRFLEVRVIFGSAVWQYVTVHQPHA